MCVTGLYKAVKTGDIILFSDRYWITSNLTRLGTRSQWTHAALVVKIPGVQIDQDDILIWEIANGVFPLHDFISKKIKLTGSRCVSLKEKLRYFPKKGNRITVMSLWHKDLNHKFIEQSWESTMGDLLLPLLRSWSNVRFRHEVTTFIRAAFSQRPWKIKIINEDSCGNIYRRPRFLKKRMFCTEALAKVYQYLGLLSPTYNTKLIVPGDFAHLSQDSSYISIPLLHSWRLIPYMSIKLSEI